MHVFLLKKNDLICDLQLYQVHKNNTLCSVVYSSAVLQCVYFIDYSLQRPSVQRRHQEWCLAAGGVG